MWNKFTYKCLNKDNDCDMINRYSKEIITGKGDET